MSSSADALAESLQGLNESVSDILATWRGLSAVYEAPEALTIYSALAALSPASQELAVNLNSAVTALRTYAETLAEMEIRRSAIVAGLEEADAEAVTWGIVSYTGIWKGSLRVRRGYGATIGFASLWLGLACLMGAAALLTPSSRRPVFFGFCGGASICLVILIIGMFWLPSFLLPKWFRLQNRRNVRRGDRA